jgi:hypothetical protein
MAETKKTKLGVKTEVKRHHLAGTDNSDELEFELPDDPVLIDGEPFCFVKIKIFFPIIRIQNY